MRQKKACLFAFAALVAGTAPLPASSKPDFNAPPVVPHVRESALSDARPRVMNYTDQLAKSLGVTDGGWEAFKSDDPLVPRLKGGLDGGTPMLKLQWRP